MFYIPIQASMTQDNTTPKEAVDAPSHFYKLINYIPTAGILVVRAGVTEFTFTAA